MDWLGHRSIHMVHRNIHLHNEESHRQMARWSRLEATVQTHCEPEAVRSSEKTQPLNILGNPPQVLSRTRSDWHSPTVPIRFSNATHFANGSYRMSAVPSSEAGIRTLGLLAGTPVFKTGCRMTQTASLTMTYGEMEIQLQRPLQRRQSSNWQPMAAIVTRLSICNE